MASNNKTSILVAEQLPQFVREDHSKFVTFLEKYYESLEQNGELLDVTKNLTNNLDIDLADEVFQQKLYNQFLKLVPSKMLGDSKILIKHIKDFYRSKGTEKSLRFLARIMLDKELDFYYPKSDVLRTSDGKWFVERSLKVTDVMVNNVANNIALSNFKNKTIRGETSNATAIVESIDTYFDKGDEVIELKLSGIRREFASEEKIFCFYTEEGVDKRLSANIFSGIIISAKVTNPGSGYQVGTTIPLISPTGRNGDIKVLRVTRGSLQGVGITFGGAGYRVGDPILITLPFNGTGAGAAGQALNVDLSERYHPNTYQIVGSLISSEANTPISNSVYSNLSSSNANTTLANAMTFWSYANCGPLFTVGVTAPGEGYNLIPNISMIGNTSVRSLGIIGRVGVVDGGLNYQIGDDVEFINPMGSYGTGAYAQVSNVAANGAITEVKMTAIPGHLAGGSGYSRNILPIPTANSLTGSGATLNVSSFIAYDDKLFGITTTIGSIQELIIISGGTGYLTPPILDFSSIGDGNANGFANVARVLYEYPGRYLNDDGQVSSFNFLEDKDYYQNFSYVVKTNESSTKYERTFNELVHPAGTKMFAEYNFIDENVLGNTVNLVSSQQIVQGGGNYTVSYIPATYNVSQIAVEYNPVTYTLVPYFAKNNFRYAIYIANNNTITLRSPLHQFEANDYAYVSFTTNATANLSDGLYRVNSVNATHFSIVTDKTYNNIEGNAIFYYPEIEVQVNNNLEPGQNVYMSFNVADPYLTQQQYTVYSANSTHFTVIDADIPEVIVETGRVNVWTSYVTVNSNNHGLVSNDTVYLTFTSGDLSNVTNGSANVVSANTDFFTVLMYNTVMTNGSISMYSRNVTMSMTNTGYSNGDNVYIWFTSGDLSDMSNGIYTLSSIDANTYTITLPKSVTSNGTASVFGNNTQIIISVKNHELSQNNKVFIEFLTGETNILTNGIYNVASVINSNSYIIRHNQINLVQNSILTFLTHTSNTGKATSALYEL